ncbi:MAG: polysaccharide deacetylase family protein [Bryobacteraceae bacterium]
MVGLISAAVAASAATAAWAVRSPRSSLVASSVHRGARDRRSIALTFDDGPSESTPELLDALESFGVRATFFQCGASAERLSSITRQVSRAGHEIGNHTQTHAPLWMRSAAFIYGELAQAQRTLQEIHGKAPIWFRAPYGVRWPGLGDAQHRLGLMGVTWTTLALDWKLDAASIVARLEKGAIPGAIFCLHDGRELASKPDIRETIGSVRRVMPILLDQGWRFETVSEILCPTNSLNV